MTATKKKATTMGRKRSSPSSLGRRIVATCLLSVVCSKSARLYFGNAKRDESSASSMRTSSPASGKGEDENVFGDVNEIQTPFMRLRDEQRYTHTGEETTTISKYILEKMKHLPMDILLNISDSSGRKQRSKTMKRQYETCALVGTAAVVTDAQRGGEIDANDAVFRTDDAPTKRYEQFVGRRTTYRIVSTSGSGSGSGSGSSSASSSSFFENIVLSGEAIKEKSIVTTSSMSSSATSRKEGSEEDESEDENTNIEDNEDQRVIVKYTSPFAKYLVVLDEASKEKIRQALSLTDEAHEENNNEGGDQLTHAIALDASFANAIREAYTTVGTALNELSENFKTRHAPPVGAYALFFALSKCDHLSLYGIPSPDSNRLERQPYWPRKTKTDGKPTKIDIFGDRVFYGLVRLFALEGFLDVVN